MVFIQKTQDENQILRLHMLSVFPYHLLFLNVVSENRYQYDAVGGILRLEYGFIILFYYWWVAFVLCLVLLRKQNL